ncbi:MAG: OmpA family protein [Dysgonamonadaceae bacterium]|jgi:outer membrane protein OmpA-like peptidoglycan-associated protein|nr:OmpA family protein [Dysgonamonadaceae bacterium]
MKTKIRVYGKDQNRTALGIVNAYVKLNPQATVSELQQAFPQSLNTVGKAKELILPVSEANKHANEFFDAPEDFITLHDGQQVTLKYLWVKAAFDAIREHALQYGIDVAKITETPPFKEGSFRLEMVDEKAPVHHATHASAAPEAACVVPETKKKKCCWLWWLLGLLLLALLLFLLCRKCCRHESCDVTPIETGIINASDRLSGKYVPYQEERLSQSILDTNDSLKVVYPTGEIIPIKLPHSDTTIYVGSLSTEAELYHFLSQHTPVYTNEKEGWITMDRTYFQFNSTQLDENATNQVKNIAMILKEFPKAKINVAGFTDYLGTPQANLDVSRERAMAIKNQLISDKTPAENIVEAKGYGSEFPVCTGEDALCRAKNRRVDIKVVSE